MNFVKKLNLHWFCTQNHIFEPFSVRRACTKSYVSSEPYPRASQIWCQNVRETWKKKVIKCRGESFARCRVITQNVEGGGLLGGGILGPPSLFRVKENEQFKSTCCNNWACIYKPALFNLGCYSTLWVILTRAPGGLTLVWIYVNSLWCT